MVVDLASDCQILVRAYDSRVFRLSSGINSDSLNGGNVLHIELQLGAGEVQRKNKLDSNQMILPGLDSYVASIEIITACQLETAWSWLVSEITPRPSSCGTFCFFDHKCWKDDTNLDETSEMLSVLYLASQLGNHKEIISMTNGHPAPPVVWPGILLDSDIVAVIESENRFRNHLAEHLSFWIRLAIERNKRETESDNKSIEFSYSKPNIQPEDKGPDGLYLEFLPSTRIEIQSVKNNLSNPKSYISSPSFRNKGIAQKKKLLDDFWRLKHKNDGLVRLEKQLDSLLGPLALGPEDKVRIGLIQRGAYNAVVVADDQYADETLFEGYEHVTNDKQKRIATYIGAKNWKMLASKTWIAAKMKLSKFGVK